MRLHDLAPSEGSVGKRFRIGRGIGSGNGKTSGRGHKGQKARSGYARKRGFEGGQMPLARRLPKRGFVNIFAKPLNEVGLSVFEAFDSGAVVTTDDLKDRGFVKQCKYGVKVLDSDGFTKPMTIRAQAFSKGAAARIQSLGGKAEVV